MLMAEGFVATSAFYMGFFIFSQSNSFNASSISEVIIPYLKPS